MERVRPWNLLNPSRLIEQLREKLEKENRIYIIPTGIGCYFIAVIFILLMISLSYGHSLAFSTTFIFISIVMISAIYTHYNLYGIELVGVSQKEDCYAGKNPAIANIVLKNNSGRGKFDIVVKSENGMSAVKSYIAANEQVTVELQTDLSKRGRYNLYRFELRTEFPFTLFRAWKIFRHDVTIWVYPQILEDIQLPERQDHLEYEDMVDASLDTKPIDDLFNEFREHRPFKDNDSWKQVDWKLYAKTGELYLKTFETTLSHIINFQDSDLKKFSHLGKEGKLSVLTTWLYLTKIKSISYDFNIREFQLTQLKNRDQLHLTDLLLKEISLIDHKAANES